MDLYKLVIADDERMIRRGLVNSINWEELGFKVVADFADGQDVIEYLQNNDADVAFVDVQMCLVSGIEVARWISEQKLPTKVVMISGYKEFNYIKEALKWGVCDYILKPLNISEIRQVFQQVKNELDKDKHGIEKLFSYREDEACAQVLQIETMMVEELLGGNRAGFTKMHHEWKGAMERVQSEYVPLLVMHLIDAVNEQLKKMGVCIEAELDKIAVFQQKGRISNEELLSGVSQKLRIVFQKLEEKKSSNKDNVIVKAKAYIEAHLAENFGVEELASYVYLNRSYFSREFKNATGETVADYIMNRRMERAIALLKEGTYSTEKIARAVGYSDVKYFQRVFKKCTGYTVREYRKLVRG